MPIFLFIGLLFTNVTFGFSQTNTDKELAKVKKLIKQTELKKRHGTQLLVLTNKDILLTQSSIYELENKINKNRIEIETNAKTITSLKVYEDSLKKEYAELIYYVYKTQNPIAKSMYIFAAEDFSQAYKRLKYLQYFTDYHKFLASNITQTADSLQNLNNLLNLKIKSNLALNENRAKKISELKTKKIKRKNQIRKLIHQKKKLEAELKEKTKANKKLHDIVNSEVKNNEKIINKPTSYELEKNKRFEAAKKKLNYPVVGVISGWFGVHDHPVLQGVTIRNDGIDITATGNKTVHCVFKGVVSKVITIPGAYKTVIVKHGQYYTVYSHLVNVKVKQKQKVVAGQKLGKVFFDKNKPELCILNFQIWKGHEKLNPYKWLK